MSLCRNMPWDSLGCNLSVIHKPIACDCVSGCGGQNRCPSRNLYASLSLPLAAGGLQRKLKLTKEFFQTFLAREIRSLIPSYAEKECASRSGSGVKAPDASVHKALNYVFSKDRATSSDFLKTAQAGQAVSTLRIYARAPAMKRPEQPPRRLLPGRRRPNLAVVSEGMMFHRISGSSEHRCYAPDE